MSSIKNIISRSSVPQSGDFCKYYHEYIINFGEKEQKGIDVPVKNMYGDVDTFSEKISEEGEFINGYKLVKLDNFQYGYIRESDNKLLLYRYDVASDFNEYGFAMVGKYGFVTWIDKDFKYLSNESYRRGKMLKEDGSFIGFNAVFDFSKGNIPLSRVCEIDLCENTPLKNLTSRNLTSVSYFSTDGELVSFKNFYNQSFLPIGSNSSKFSHGNDFNESGYSIDQDKILFAEGYYMNSESFIKLSDKLGLIPKIKEVPENIRKDEINKEINNLESKLSTEGNLIYNNLMQGPLTSEDNNKIQKINQLRLKLK